jgi:hypothetical protein
MLVDENTCFFLDSERWVAYAESLVFHTILAQIHDHYLLHAGVVSWEGKGVILCGEANRGKTTLTLALVQEGFKFLSDEAAFIDRVSGKVVPFPRSVGLRQKSLTMFSQLDHSVRRQLTKSLSGDDKWLVDVEEVFPGSLGDACEVGVVVFMEGFSQATELVPLSTAEALFRSSKFAHTSAVEPFESMLSVADIFERASCFRLSCGSVAETVAVISEMVRQKWT